MFKNYMKEKRRVEDREPKKKRKKLTKVCYQRNFNEIRKHKYNNSVA